MTQLLIAMLGGSAIFLALSDRRGLRLGWKSQNGKAIRWAKAVREVMGHADMAMIHRHYQHVLDRQRRAVMDHAPVPDLGTFSGHMKQPSWAHFTGSDEEKKQ